MAFLPGSWSSDDPITCHRVLAGAVEVATGRVGDPATRPD
jgi:hypothetical protein